MGRRICAALLLAVMAWIVPAGPAPAAGPDPLVITYEVRGRGNVTPLEELAATAAAVYADPRGWSLGGSIRFERVASGGNFTLWLAADSLMSTFGGACGRLWSCRNGRNVVINEDRWRGASNAWLSAAAPLETYRQMVLNHETGHWLGFGHGYCSKPGAPAPVMQQQSIRLSGCTPNPWPLPSERAALAARRHVPIIDPSGAAPSPSTTTTAPRATTTTTRPKPTTTTTVRATTSTSTTTAPRRPPSGQEAACRRQTTARPSLRPWQRCL